MEYNPFKMIL